MVAWSSLIFYYLNLDFFEHFGQSRYRQISESVKATVSGLGDWLFRGIAFPELCDNTTEYLQRYGRTFEMDQGFFESPHAATARVDRYLDELIERYALDSYDLVGFSSMFAQNVASFALARKLKQRRPAIVTAIGGANCETTMGRVIARHVSVIDFVFSGPALTTFPDFVERLRDGRMAECHRITGVYSKDKLEALGVEAGNEIGAELSLDTVLPLDYDDFIEAHAQKSPGLEPFSAIRDVAGMLVG